MRLSTLLLATVALASSGTAFAATPGQSSHAALRGARCAIQHVHTPAGKMVHNAPILRCPAERMLASNARIDPRIESAPLAAD